MFYTLIRMQVDILAPGWVPWNLFPEVCTRGKLSFHNTGNYRTASNYSVFIECFNTNWKNGNSVNQYAKHKKMRRISQVPFSFRLPQGLAI